LKRKTKIEWPEPLKWKQTNDHDWSADEDGTRIRRLTNRYIGLDHDTFNAHRRGLYLGSRRSLKAAKDLIDRDPRGQDNGG
jgi:hypothetical protein